MDAALDRGRRRRRDAAPGESAAVLLGRLEIDASCTRGDPFPARGLVRGDRRPRRRGRARGDRSPLGRPVPERGGRESAHRARARAHTRAGRAPLEPGRARSLERQRGRRRRGRGRGRGRPRRARRARRATIGRIAFEPRAAGAASRRLRRRRARSRGEALRAARRARADERRPLGARALVVLDGDRRGRGAAGRERVRRLGARARRPSGGGRAGDVARLPRAPPPRPRSAPRRCRPLHLGRRPLGARRLLGHGSRRRRVGRRRPLPRLRRAHARGAPRADGRRPRERPAAAQEILASR